MSIAIEPRKTQKPRHPGSAMTYGRSQTIGTFTIVADDNDHLEAFSEYMPYQYDF
jgi:hypothetical protein